MKKRVFGRKFSRARKGRSALLRSLLREFALHGEITTTVTRAKFIKPVVDRLVTSIKRNDLEGRRAVFAFLAQDSAAQTAFEDAGKRFKDVSSGFTTARRLGVRRGDGAPMARISWFEKKSGEPEQMEPRKKEINV